MRKFTVLVSTTSLILLMSILISSIPGIIQAGVQSVPPVDIEGAAGSQAELVEATIGLSLFKTYSGTYGYVVAGAGVRNTGRATLSLRLPKGATAVDAWLYWMILDDDTPDSKNNLANLNGFWVTGSQIGNGPDPCWGQVTKGYVYRANVKNPLGNTGGMVGGAFGVMVSINSKVTTGMSPWEGTQYKPMAEYVGLVIVYTRATHPTGILRIYDGYHEGSSIQSFTYNWPARTAGGARFSSLTGDGQRLGSDWLKTLTFDNTVIDTHVLSGDDPSITSYATHEGSLADTDTYNVDSLVPTAGGSKTITWDCKGDCISWAALIFSSGSD